MLWEKIKYLLHIIIALTITASVGITACKSSTDETKISADDSTSSVVEENKELESQKRHKWSWL